PSYLEVVILSPPRWAKDPKRHLAASPLDLFNEKLCAGCRVSHPPKCYTPAMLADFAVRVENSRGRRYPQAPHPFRNDFQRDRDRIIHARAFRRLGNKTQVFTRRYSDHFRNRLTH